MISFLKDLLNDIFIGNTKKKAGFLEWEEEIQKFYYKCKYKFKYICIYLNKFDRISESITIYKPTFFSIFSIFLRISGYFLFFVFIILFFYNFNLFGNFLQSDKLKFYNFYYFKTIPNSFYLKLIVILFFFKFLSNFFLHIIIGLSKKYETTFNFTNNSINSNKVVKIFLLFIYNNIYLLIYIYFFILFYFLTLYERKNFLSLISNSIYVYYFYYF